MSRTAWPTVASGDAWSASQNNTYGRDNDSAYWVFTTAGDMAYASSSAALARLAIGTSQQILRVNSGGTAPAWATLTGSGLAWRSTVQSIPNNVATAISFDSTAFDDYGYWSGGSPTRLTAPATGHYIVGGVGAYQSLATGTAANIALQKNGASPNVAIYEYTLAVGAFWEGHFEVLLSLTAGDYVEMMATQNSGISVNFATETGNAGYPIMYIMRVH